MVFRLSRTTPRFSTRSRPSTTPRPPAASAGMIRPSASNGRWRNRFFPTATGSIRTSLDDAGSRHRRLRVHRRPGARGAGATRDVRNSRDVVAPAGGSPGGHYLAHRRPFRPGTDSAPPLSNRREPSPASRLVGGARYLPGLFGELGMEGREPLALSRFRGHGWTATRRSRKL